jgi:hypothetical protein
MPLPVAAAFAVGVLSSLAIDGAYALIWPDELGAGTLNQLKKPTKPLLPKPKKHTVNYAICHSSTGPDYIKGKNNQYYTATSVFDSRTGERIKITSISKGINDKKEKPFKYIYDDTHGNHQYTQERNKNGELETTSFIAKQKAEDGKWYVITAKKDKNGKLTVTDKKRITP